MNFTKFLNFRRTFYLFSKIIVVDCPAKGGGKPQPAIVRVRVFRFSGIFSNSAISLRIRARGKKYLSDIVLEYIIFAC